VLHGADRERQRAERIGHLDQARRDLRLRRLRPGSLHFERFETDRLLHARLSVDLRRIAERTRLRDVELAARIESVGHVGSGPRDERRQELRAHRRTVVAEVRVAERRRLPEQREHAGDRTEQRQNGGGALHPIPFSPPAGSAASRERAPARARRPPSRKAFRILYAVVWLTW
jgi:hypothetical protein